MLIPEHKYLVESCSGMQSTRDGKHQYITVILKKPAPTDEFGDKIPGLDDDLFECTIWNKNAQEMPVLSAGDKVEAQLAFRGSSGISRQDGSTWYNVQVNIRNIKKL